MRSGRLTKKEHLQQITDEYMASGETWPASLHDVAAWAIRTHRADYSRKSKVQLLAKELQEALCDQKYTDPQGRRVRKKHAFKVSQTTPDGDMVQRTLWCDIETAKPGQMRRSLQQRRRQVLGDCTQLKIDTDSYNDNNPHGASIQMSFNFEPDLVEREHDTEYNPPPLEDDDEEDEV